MNYKTFLLSIFFVSLFFSGCGDNKKETQKQQKDLSIYQLKTLHGKTLTLKKTQNGFILQNSSKKLLLIDIYATWCPPCKAEAEVLSNLAKKYEKDLDIVALTLEPNASEDTISQFALENNATYPLVIKGENQRLIDTIASELHVGKHFGIPLIVLYKDGKVLNYYMGATEEEFIESDIKNNLGN